MATTRRALPTKVNEGQYQDVRVDSYGNMLTEPYTPVQQCADEGTYFAAVNATDNTAITASIATAYSATASAFIALRNNDTNSDAGQGKRIVLDYIKLIAKTVPASATDWRYVIDVDSVQSRFTSGGTAITATSTNMQSSVGSIALLNVGALTTVALSSSGRTIDRGIIRTAIPVTLDQYIFKFGTNDAPTGGAATNGTNAQIITFACPPVVLNQNSCFVMSLFGSGNAVTAATYQIVMGWAER